MQKFSEILKAELKNQGIGQKELEKMLYEAGITNITNKRICEYVNEIKTPDFIKAKDILTVLKTNYKDSDIKEMLKLNRESIRLGHSNYDTFESVYVKEIQINLKLRNIVPDVSPDRIEKLLSERVKEIYKDSKRKEMTSYIESLIREDLYNTYGKQGIRMASDYNKNYNKNPNLKTSIKGSNEFLKELFKEEK